MAYRIEFAPRALREAEEAHDWIAQHSPQRAARWLAGLFEKIGSLDTFPERCSLAPESDAFGEEIRQLLYGKRRGIYRILFAVRNDVVRVLTVRHSARGPAEP